MSSYAGESEIGGGNWLGDALQRGLDRVLALELHLSLEFWLYAALMVVVLVMRFADLGNKALHHDESLHATYSWYLYVGKGYVHDPLMHGPFLFHITALVYWLFGASDASSRFAPALLGSAVVLMPLLLRPWLGRIGAFAAALFIAFSPSLLYYDRFIRDDPWVVLWTIGLFVCVFRYRLAIRSGWLYAAAAFLCLSFASLELTFFISVALLLYLDGCVASRLADQIALNQNLQRYERHLLFAGLLPIAWLLVVLWPLLPGLRSSVGVEELGPDANMLLVLGLLTAPQFSAAVRVPLQSLLHYNLQSGAGYTLFGQLLTRTQFVGGVTVIFLLLVTVLIGVAWDWRRWLIAAAVFYVPYFLLFTTFLTNKNGFGSGIWGSLAYWLDQQDVQRGAQPVFYYAMTLSTYEYLTLGLAAAGLIWYAVRQGYRNWSGASEQVTSARPVVWRALISYAHAIALLIAVLLIPVMVFVNGHAGNRPSAVVAFAIIGLATAAMSGDSLRQLLVFYFGSLLFAISVAGEKMPWITEHPALPLTLLAALFVKDAIGDLLSGTFRWRMWLTLAFAGVVAAGVAMVVAPAGVNSALRTIALPLLAVAVVTATVYLARILLHERARMPALLGLSLAAVGTVAFVGFFGVLTFRNDYRMNFIHPDTPDEMLIYTQSSPDIPKLMKRIDQLAMESGQGHNLKVTVDSNDAFTWPWAWYLRDYKNTTYPDLSFYAQNPSALAGFDPGSVLLANNADQQVASSFAGIFGPGLRYHHRWWFPEGYKGTTTAASFLKRIENGSALTRWWTYITTRQGFTAPPSDVSPPKGQPIASLGQPNKPGEEALGSVDAVAYFPATWVPGKGLTGSVSTSAAPARVAGSTLTIGTIGVAAGQFSRPAGVASDQDGNIYVADSLNNRVQKFDRNGAFLAQAGGATGGVQFHEPWGIAVGLDGSVYVADTWAHRIVKLDSNLKLVKTWGQPVPSTGPTSPLDMYGPRGIAVNASGDLWVTDTGNARVTEFDPNGTPLGSFGTRGTGPGQFDEPVGIAIAPDGTIYVADSWNNRIQSFDAAFHYKGEFAAKSWVLDQAGRDSENKPYLAVLLDGTIVTTFPAGDRLVQYDPSGNVLRSLDRLAGMATPLQRPLGVAVTAAGEILLSDGVLDEVVRLPESALP